MNIYITIFPKSIPLQKITLFDVQKDYRSNCVQLKSLNQDHKLKFLEYLINDGVYEIENLNMLLLDNPTEIESIKSIKEEYRNAKEPELGELEDDRKYKLKKIYKYHHRVEFDELYSRIHFEKNFGYENLVSLEEMVDNQLAKRVSEKREKEIIKHLKQVAFCYKLSTDIDSKYEFINPIYVLAYTIANYVEGSIQIDDHHYDNWECGIYEKEEFKRELENKIRTITIGDDSISTPSS